MKILAVSDIHGRLEYEKKIIEMLSTSDLIVISGDITNFGGRREALEVLNTIRKYNQNILAVPGNCDRYDVLELLKDEHINLHGEIKKIGDLTFFGIGGSGHTPFNTPQEYSDEEIIKILNNYENKGGKQILVSHSPPINTAVDRTLMGIHAGSKLIRQFIEKNQFDLCLCGHIHEARNTDKLGKTLIVNPGPFPKYYATIEITDRIRIFL
ncbi:MAG: YfcE family phosphodiesterase [candidate division WOR-3 bacterium]|nr:YfcE family phosphodiesterase [candidate division WOR-3 bacterium]